jgi:ABC-type molybdate transport system substrate-binding protein
MPNTPSHRFEVMPIARPRSLIASLSLALATALSIVLPAAAEPPLRIFAAGSLVGPMNEWVAASGLPAGAVALPVFGPAGLLRQRIEAGEAADVYASADLNQPRKLVAAGRAATVIPFARNRMCVVGKASLGLTADNVLDRLLDPGLRLATSTPVSDPGGDYAWAVFDRAEAVRPGARKTLQAKALQLIGSPNAMVPVAGRSPSASIFLADRADALLYYCSGSAATLREVPGLVSLPLPSTLEVHPVYGLTVMGSHPDAARIALFILSEQGQAMLAKYDLLPLSAP